MNHQEPKFETEPRLWSILEELKAREPIFHRPEFGASRADYEAMMEEGFWEVGASGKRYSREYVLYVLETRPPNPEEASWVTKDFQCREIARDNYLLTYTLSQGERLTRRTTLWRRSGAAWKIVYHQGTVVEA